MANALLGGAANALKHTGVRADAYSSLVLTWHVLSCALRGAAGVGS